MNTTPTYSPSLLKFLEDIKSDCIHTTSSTTARIPKNNVQIHELIDGHVYETSKWICSVCESEYVFDYVTSRRQAGTEESFALLYFIQHEDQDIFGGCVYCGDYNHLSKDCLIREKVRDGSTHAHLCLTGNVKTKNYSVLTAAIGKKMKLCVQVYIYSAECGLYINDMSIDKTPLLMIPAYTETQEDYLRFIDDQLKVIKPEVGKRPIGRKIANNSVTVKQKTPRDLEIMEELAENGEIRVPLSYYSALMINKLDQIPDLQFFIGKDIHCRNFWVPISKIKKVSEIQEVY